MRKVRERVLIGIDGVKQACTTGHPLTNSTASHIVSAKPWTSCPHTRKRGKDATQCQPIISFSEFVAKHNGKPVIRRVPKSSPCSNHRAHGEESLCRGPNTEHTAKIKHTAKAGFAVCSNLSTRRNDFFAVCQRPAHGKDSATWPDVHGRSTPSYFAVCLR